MKKYITFDMDTMKYSSEYISDNDATARRVFNLNNPGKHRKRLYRVSQRNGRRYLRGITS